MDYFCNLCLVVVMLSRMFIAALWSPAGKGLTSWFLILMFNCVFVIFPCGSLVKFSTWLYRFLIFAAFLTFIVAAYDIRRPKVMYTYYTFNFCFLFMKSSMYGWLMEDWRKISFFYNSLQSIYTSIVSCVYNLKTYTHSFQWYVV